MLTFVASKNARNVHVLTSICKNTEFFCSFFKSKRCKIVIIHSYQINLEKKCLLQDKSIQINKYNNYLQELPKI